MYQTKKIGINVHNNLSERKKLKKHPLQGLKCSENAWNDAIIWNKSAVELSMLTTLKGQMYLVYGLTQDEITTKKSKTLFTITRSLWILTLGIHICFNISKKKKIKQKNFLCI